MVEFLEGIADYLRVKRTRSVYGWSITGWSAAQRWIEVEEREVPPR
jgi:hypothetical protein